MRVLDYFYTKKPELKGLLLPEQIEMLEDLADVTVKSQLVSCGRGFGKTMLTAGDALYFADDYSNQIGKPIVILLISAQKAIYDRIDEFFLNDKTLKPRLRQQPSGTSGYEIPRERFQFLDTMSVIYNVLPTVKQIEGIRADVIIFDESQDIPRNIYNKAIGCLKKDLIGKIICVGTPYVDKGLYNNWFIEKVSDPSSGKIKFLLSQHSSRQCIWNDVARWEEEWSSARQSAEIDGEAPTREEREFFNQEKWQSCFINCGTEREGRNDKHCVEIGIDWGFGAPNPTVITVTEKLGTKRKLLLQEVQKNVDFDRLEAICALYSGALIKVDSQPDQFNTQFRKVHKGPFHKIDAKIHKDLMMSQLRDWRVLMGQLKISDAFIDLYKEGVRYHPKKRASDNRIDSLALSCYEPVVPFDEKPPFKMIIIGPRK